MSRDKPSILRATRRGCVVTGAVGSNLQESSLYQKIPYSAGLINVNLDQIARFASAKLPPSTGVLPYKSLLDDKIRLGKNAKL